MTWPRVTVITPSFNHGQFIERTIRSVLSQDYPNLEYWVIDGGSTDGTLEVLKRYEDRLCWLSEPDGGQAAAINKGFARATGQILAWLNSDDTYLSDAISISAKALLASSAGMTYGGCLMTDENDVCIREYDLRPRPTMDVFDRLLNRDPSFIPQPSVFLARHAVDAVGSLDESLYMCMDYDYWLRVSKSFPVQFVREYIGTIRMHPGTKTSNFQLRSFFELRRVRGHYDPRAISTFYPRECYRFVKGFIGRVRT